MLEKSIVYALKQLLKKIAVYNESYIFVLEATNLSLEKLKTQEPDDLFRTIQGSFLRLNDLLTDSGLNSSEHYRGVLFINLISNVELFFSLLVKAAIVKNPQKVWGTKIELKEIIEGANTDELIERCAEETINRLLYEKPDDYLIKLCEILSIDESEILECWPNYVEAKARRDLGVHNDWVCNEIYLRKTAYVYEDITTPQVGDKLNPSKKEYCGSVTDNISEMAQKFVVLMLKKHS
jgi:hypothetical protein